MFCPFFNVRSSEKRVEHLFPKLIFFKPFFQTASVFDLIGRLRKLEYFKTHGSLFPNNPSLHKKSKLRRFNLPSVPKPDIRPTLLPPMPAAG